MTAFQKILLGLCFTALAAAPRAVAARQPAVAPPVIQPLRSFPSDADVLAILRERVNDKRSAGIVVGLLEPDGRTRVIAYGDPGPGQPALDGNSVFEIGSITKVFTGTTLALMVREGTVRLDDPVQRYLPAGVRIPERSGKAITLAHLAEQNSGLPRMPDNLRPRDMANPYADYSVQQMYDFLAKYQLPRDPGASFEYSNIGVGLLGHVLARVDQKSFEEMERERIWAPLGMTSTGISFTAGMKTRLAFGHDERGNVVPNWDLPTIAGAGAIRSTTIDMLKFLDASLHPERGALQSAMAFAQQERAPAGDMRIGLNWFRIPAGGDTIVWHNGGTGGYRTFIGLVPSRKMGVVVMTNSGGAGADDIGRHLLVPSLALTPKPTPPKQRVAVDVSLAVLAGYVGTYQLAPGFQLDVTLRAGTLWVQATNQQAIRLWSESETAFFMKEVDAQITFIRATDGSATSLVLHQNGQNMPAPKRSAPPPSGIGHLVALPNSSRPSR